MTGAAGPTPFPPHVLREYALLGDGYRGALVGPRGDICWMCVPGWASDAVFSGLLGGRGVYAVTPAAPRYVWGGYYEDGSLIWNGRWVTTDGTTVECRDALAYPGDPHRAVLLRRVRAVEGDAVVHVTLDARAGFGRRALRDLRREDGRWTGRTGDLRLRWTGAERAEPGEDGILRLELRVPAGGHHDLTLELADRPYQAEPADADALWHVTTHAWQTSAPHLPDCYGPRDALHAHAVLRGMTTPGGGTVAAATTSLPERADSDRNYDYRYAWIRDQCYIGHAAAAAGDDELLDSSARFVVERLLADGPDLVPAYLAGSGGRVPSEEHLHHLPGYPGTPSVRTGNWVNGQFQLDTFGEALLMLSAAAGRDRLDDDGRRAMEVAADAIGRRWPEPDAGIWELPARQWTHSKLICVAGLRAAARRSTGTAPGDWLALADAILADTGKHAIHPSGRWQWTPDDPRVDAALLLPGIRGAVPPDDPRTVATRAAVNAELRRDDYIYRFRPDERPLGDAEGAFLLCGLIAALAGHHAGDPVDAARLYERNRAACGPPGLYAEEYDVAERQLRGNLPQAFVHALLLETAVTIAA